MDRLLELLLRQFVRRGTLRFTTARGSVFTVGDGNGPPVAIRFMTKAAQRGVLLDPELKLGEAYMDGTLRVEQGSIADLLAIVLGQTTDGMPPNWARLQWWLRFLLPAAAAVQCPDARAAQCRASLRSRRPALLAVPRCRPAILLRLFRAPRASRSTTPSSPRSAISPPSCCRRTNQRALDIGCGWGGLRSISQRFCGARVTGVTLSQEQWQRAGERAAGREPDRLGRFPHAGLSRPARDIRPHRFGRHVRARRRVLLRRVLPQVRRAADRRRRHAAAFDRPLRGPERHQSLDRQVHLPRRLHPGAVGGAAGDRARGPAGHRHRDSAAALRRDAASLARALHGAPRGGRAHLRRALRADVGILPGRLRDGVPRAGA